MAAGHAAATDSRALATAARAGLGAATGRMGARGLEPESEHMTPLSVHFSLEEAVFSETAARFGLDNTPNAEQIENIRALCVEILEPLRGEFGAIHVNSCYRSPAVNSRAGGQRHSQHLCLENSAAADLRPVGLLSRGVAIGEALERLGAFALARLPVDQCALEFASWLHCSHRRQSYPLASTLPPNRGEGLRIYRAGWRTVSEPWVPVP